MARRVACNGAEVRYIELVGLPGSGKTTLLRGWEPIRGVVTIHQLVRDQRLRSARTHPRARLARLLPDAVALRVLRGPEPDFYDLARFVTDHAELHAHVAEVAARVPAAEQRVVAQWMLFEAFGRHAYAARTGAPGAGLIVDEGILQRFAYLATVGRGPGGTPPSTLPDQLPAIDGIVVLACPVGLAEERVRARGAEFQETHLLPAMNRELERLTADLGARGVPVTTLDARAPRQELLEQVRGAVEATYV